MYRQDTANREARQPSRTTPICTTDEVIAHLPKIYQIVARHLIETGEIEIVDEHRESSAGVSP